jgi:LAO/AO transport system kinase
MSIVADKVVAGDIRAAARLIREIDDGMPGIRETLKDLHSHTGNAYVIGITGAPGVGKSTLVDQLIHQLRQKGKTVGVLAVDPTSPFSGGAILGDRVRMQRHSVDKGVFIRSLATRGHFGGLTQSTRSAINVLDAMGKDYIIVETVGVGQDEVDVVKNAHTTVIVVIPGMGDDIQAIKAGILEVGDVFVINKADHPGVDKTMSDLKWMMDINHEKYEESGWKPPILTAEAANGTGVDALLDEIGRHSVHMKEMPAESKFRSIEEKTRSELTEMVKSRLIEEVLESLTGREEFKQAVSSIIRGTKDPYSACDELVLPVLDACFRKGRT